METSNKSVWLRQCVDQTEAVPEAVSFEKVMSGSPGPVSLAHLKDPEPVLPHEPSALLQWRVEGVPALLPLASAGQGSRELAWFR